MYEHPDLPGEKERTIVDIGRAIGFIFQDQQWLKKVLIGGLLVFIPLIRWLIIGGYFLRLIRQVAEGRDLPLPEWNDFGGDLVRGLKGFVVGVVWSLPVIVLAVCTGALGAVGDSAGSDAPRAMAAVLALAGNCLSFLLSLVVAFFQPLFYSRLAVTERISDGLAFGAIFDEARGRFVDLLVVLLVAFVISLVASFGLLLCLVGVVFTTFIGYGMTCHLYGQVRRRITGTQAEPFAPSPAF
uniref:DUF4013 domain-containing protein n=1 Tax=Thermorudis sp. TaxID=1969470 RepID=A0A7C2WPA8_9BACT